MLSISEQIKRLTKVGAALTSEHNLEKLLEMIVSEARAITNADAGSLYIKEGNRLKFVVSQNDTLARRYKDKGTVMEKFKPFPMEISNNSIAGYVANNGEILNISDVRKISCEKPYRHNPSFDEKNNYRTQSMLVAPMINQRDEIIGVLQLINAQSPSLEDPSVLNVVPFDDLQVDLIQSIASQAAVAISNAKLNEDIKKAYLDTIYRLSIAAEYKDQDTASHIKRMSLYSRVLAKNLGMSDREVELMLYSSPMHDVGKLGVPDAILLKPGPLNPEERAVMENHTVYGAKIMEGSESEVLEYSRVIAMTHHEKWNGKGYPQKLAGEDIPLTGRIVALADVFDALTSRRPYKRAWTVEEAVAEITKDSGTHFDPKLIECFLNSVEEIKYIYAQHKD